MFKIYTEEKYLPKNYKLYRFHSDDFFKQFLRGEDFLMHEDVQKIVYEIEQSKFINKNIIETRDGEIISSMDLCTDCKTIINHMFLAQYEDKEFSQEFIQDFDYAGMNVIHALMEYDYLQKYDSLPFFIEYCPWSYVNPDIQIEVNNTIMTVKDIHQYCLYGEDDYRFGKKFKMI